MIPQLTDFVVAVLVAALLLLFAVLLFKALEALVKRVRQPGLVLVLEALKPYAVKAIFAAESMALSILETTEQKISGADKLKIAADTYALLPAVLFIAGRAFPIGWVKTVITKEAWTGLIQRVFDEADAVVKANRDYLKKGIKDLTGTIPGQLGA